MKIKTKARAMSGLTVLDKVTKLEAAMNGFFQERDHVVRGMILAIITRQHVMLYGTHGTAKSQMGTMLFKAFCGTKTVKVGGKDVEVPDGRIFSTQCTHQMPEDAVFGPPNIKKMQVDGVIEYCVDDMLPTADFAFLEEMFDANDGVLRSMLDILNERIFRKGKQNLECPLRTAVCTSNFYKDTDELAAVIDRFLVRVKIAPIQDTDSVEKMLVNYLEGNGIDNHPQLSLKELDELNEGMQNVTVDVSIIGMYLALLKELGVVSSGTAGVSDRRKCWVLNLIRASAYLDGRDEVTVDDLEAARFGLVVVGTDQDNWFDQALLSATKNYASHKQLNADVKEIQNALNKLLAKKDATDASSITGLFGKVSWVTGAVTQLRKDNNIPADIDNVLCGIEKKAAELQKELTAKFESLKKK